MSDITDKYPAMAHKTATNRWFVVAVDVFFILSLISIYQYVMEFLRMKPGVQDWGLFEVLVNYEAGFIRRGLIGQILYWIAENTHVSLSILIPVFLIPPFIFVAAFMVGKFRRYGIRWWLLAVIGYGLLASVIRKDFIIYALFIALLYIYRSRRPAALRVTAMSLVSVVMLLTYETAMFMCLGFTALLVLRDKSLPKVLRAAYPAVLCLTMLILLGSTGATGAGHAIYASWQNIYPGIFPVSDIVQNSLDWSVSDSLYYNINLLMPVFSAPDLVRYILFIILIPYVYITYMYVDTFRPAPGFPYVPRVFTTLYIFFMLCMLPMWAGLSCDYGRMLYHATLSSLCVAFILPESAAESTFPRWALLTGGWIGRLFARIPRSVYSITLLTIALTPPYSFYHIADYSFKTDSLLYRVMLDTCDFAGIVISHIFG